MLIGYSRCSSSGQNHASQIDALQKAGCERIFQETESGTRADRAELAKMLEFARPGDQIAVYRLDRLARNLRHLLDIVDQMTKREIGLKSLTEAIDTSTPSGRLAVHLFASMAQFEAEQVKLRCAAGRAAAVARGRMGGRPTAMDETKRRIARTLMADDQLSMAQIAEQVGVAPSTLYRTLPGGRSALAAAVVTEEVAA
jgi:DNA invertase Pin-like site-specific DNA recombinase